MWTAGWPDGHAHFEPNTTIPTAILTIQENSFGSARAQNRRPRRGAGNFPEVERISPVMCVAPIVRSVAHPLNSSPERTHHSTDVPATERAIAYERIHWRPGLAESWAPCCSVAAAVRKPTPDKNHRLAFDRFPAKGRPRWQHPCSAACGRAEECRKCRS